jgi:hypothetical protein
VERSTSLLTSRGRVAERLNAAVLKTVDGGNVVRGFESPPFRRWQNRGLSQRSRILAFGSAGALVLAGGLCAALVGGLAGQILTIVLVSAGLGGAVLLAFLEVGLSEDRERERSEERQRRRRGSPADARRRPWRSRWPRRPR